MAESWDYSVDVLVIGSGNGGLTAALCSYEMGSPDVLVVEKGARYGGTSSVSGGGVWVPCNRYAREAGADDSIEARSEEHTSELQSRGHLVCRLLLEKKRRTND